MLISKVLRAVLLSISTLVVLMFVVSASATQEPNAPEEPKLILAITIDGLRGDVPFRFSDRLGQGGFRYLMDQGLVYTNAHYLQGTTFTAVGHATLFTGGNPAQHGLAGNDWYDYETGRDIYCVEDDRHTLIGAEPRAREGVSPRNLTSSTYGDELVLGTDGRSRVFSVSIKDRGAILPGGRLGKAFWYSSGTGDFVTSTYYYDSYPSWVTEWNEAKHADRYEDEAWELHQPAYIFSDTDDHDERLPDSNEHERPYGHMGNTFPHSISGAEEPSDFYGALRYTPMGDELTLDFAKELMRQESVGLGEATDMLAISFSVSDYIAHAFGSNGLEAEDNFLRLDATLKDLFSFIDEIVGLDKTLIVLSSDHGFDDIPEYKKELDFPSGRHQPDTFVEELNTFLQERYESEENFVIAFWNPSLYLNRETIANLGLDPVEVQQALAEEALNIPGMALAMTRNDLLAGTITDNPIMRKVQRSFHPKRSGSVLLVQDQFWYLYPNAEEFAAMHGSPYAYDTYVPVMIAGPGVPNQMVSRPVAPEDIASTITTYMGLRPPSSSVGEVLFEALPAGPTERAAPSQ